MEALMNVMVALMLVTGALMDIIVRLMEKMSGLIRASRAFIDRKPVRALKMDLD